MRLIACRPPDMPEDRRLHLKKRCRATNLSTMSKIARPGYPEKEYAAAPFPMQEAAETL
jgi:hypothetical protein